LGIPFQDARSILPLSTQTFIIASYDFLALKGFLANRLCRNSQHEIHTVAKLMLAEVRRVFPLLAKYMVSHCDRAKKCLYHGKLFEPCGKWPREYNREDYLFSKEMNPNTWGE